MVIIPLIAIGSPQLQQKCHHHHHHFSYRHIWIDDGHHSIDCHWFPPPATKIFANFAIVRIDIFNFIVIIALIAIAPAKKDFADRIITINIIFVINFIIVINIINVIIIIIIIIIASTPMKCLCSFLCDMSIWHYDTMI